MRYNSKILRATFKVRVRHCNICKKKLPQDRYFNHRECLERRMESLDIFGLTEFHPPKGRSFGV